MGKVSAGYPGMEDKGLRVNMDKTKILVCRAKPVQSGSQVASGVWCMW